MKTVKPIAAALLIAVAGIAPATAQPAPSGSIGQAIVAAPDQARLAAALQAAGLADQLNGAGPFTLFAPTDAAFAKLPAGTLDRLMRPESQPQLANILSYHVVKGDLGTRALLAAIRKGRGRVTLPTVQGGTLTASRMGDTIMLTDGRGGMSHVTLGDQRRSNGVVHIVDAVLLPR